MRILQSKGQAPKDTVRPDDIPIKGLFSLDVDSTIWSDLGLYDDSEEVIPLWLSDENVRDGICAMLAIHHCKEELARIAKERSAMQEWFSRRWVSATAALLAIPTSSGLHYLCTVRRQHLLQLYCKWKRSVDLLPVNLSSDIASWGPRPTDVHAFLLLQQHMSGKDQGLHPYSRVLYFDSDDVDADDDCDDLETQAGEVLEVMEAMEAMHQFNKTPGGSDAPFDDRYIALHDSLVPPSPRKRVRFTYE